MSHLASHWQTQDVSPSRFYSQSPMRSERGVVTMSQSRSYEFPKFFIVSADKLVLVIALALFGPLFFASAQNRFVHLPSYPAGGSLPTLLAQHDVNGDGKLDVILMNINATTKVETISLLLGTGTGG